MKRSTNTIALAAITVILSLITIDRMLAKLDMSQGKNTLTRLCLLTFLLLFVVLYNKRTTVSNGLRKTSICFLQFTIPSMLFSTTGINVLYGWIAVLFVPLGILVGKHTCKICCASSKPDRMLGLIILPAIIGSLWILLMSGTLDLFNLGRDYIFSVVVFVPLLFYFKSPVLKYGTLILVLYVVVLSTKRTALIAIGSATVVYLLANIQEIKRVNIKSAFSAVFFSICIVFAVQSLYSGTVKDAFDVTVERMSNLEDKSNEAREDIYTQVYSKIEASPVSSIAFGHGYNGVTKDLFGHPAHNDYLEIIYDYGVFAVFFYVLILLGLLNLYLRQGVRFSKNPHVAIVLVTFVILNSANCIITNASYVYVCMFCIGWALEYTNLNNKENGRLS